MAEIDLNFALSQVHEIVFYKRDEITTDLIFCEVSISSDTSGQVLFFHEEMPNWQELIDRVSELPDFDMRWFEKSHEAAVSEAANDRLSNQGLMSGASVKEDNSSAA